MSYIFRTIRKHLDKIFKKSELLEFVKPFVNQKIIEIGGPSPIFRKKGLFPIYHFSKDVENVNFSYNTIWENEISEGNTFKYDNKTGKQFVLEASNLDSILDSTYDGLISSHCLEHTANPIKVLFEWKRVLKPNGHLLLILPNKKNTFDNHREYTTFEHIVEDYRNETTESDLTHLEEIQSRHNKTRDNNISETNLKTRSLDNFKNRCMHHHVFNDDTVKKMGDFVGLSLIKCAKYYPYHLVYLLKKS